MSDTVIRTLAMVVLPLVVGAGCGASGTAPPPTTTSTSTSTTLLKEPTHVECVQDEEGPRKFDCKEW